ADDGHAPGIPVIRIGEFAAHEYGRAHRGEVPRGDRVQVDGGHFVLSRNVAGNHGRIPPLASRKRRDERATGGGEPGSVVETIEKVPEEKGGAVTLVSSFGRIDVDQQQAVAAKAEV